MSSDNTVHYDSAYEKQECPRCRHYLWPASWSPIQLNKTPGILEGICPTMGCGMRFTARMVSKYQLRLEKEGLL